uniref:receptor protein-tyrosine kinase n=1 Tax=Syphacia muris TaxID=451379 RepID=A0A0N5AUT8_9BILA
MNKGGVIRVYIPNGSVKSVRLSSETTVERVIHVVIAGLGIDDVSYGYFAIRLLNFPTAQTSNNDDCYWLHSGFTIQQVYDKYFGNTVSCSQLRFELRMRFVPSDLQELYQTQVEAFMFLHDQVLADYLSQVSWKVPTDTAIELAALQLRRELGEINKCFSEKSSKLDELEISGAFQKYLPETIIVTTKPKQLRKVLLSGIKKFASFSPTECIFWFLKVVKQLAQFDVEIFRCSIGKDWSAPVDILIGMRVGISYNTDSRCIPKLITEIKFVVDIAVLKLRENSAKATIKLRLSGSSQPLYLTVADTTIAESLAHIVDGYQMLLVHRGSVWIPDGEYSGEHYIFGVALFFVANLLSFSRTFEGSNGLSINRLRVTLDELLGDGQFGNVYRGTYFETDEGSPRAVAVKVCKLENEALEMRNFLSEAYRMGQFDHPYIIKLLGICTESPTWIVMELAPYGELRHYLTEYHSCLDLSIQLLFCHQLSMAVSYLHCNKFVHRDIAARNVLVSTPRAVKLSDFGLTRCIDEQSVYISSKGKLPIKWMAPESINFRQFTMASDVWMFGVCMWEILTYGVKPWQGIRNHDVILRIEADERLEKPDGCPAAVYELLRRLWVFDWHYRPNMSEVEFSINYLLDQLDRGVSFNMLVAPSLEESISFKDSKESLKAVPVLNVDSSVVPISTIWRTLEQQRIQSEKDSKWLEEEEEKLLPTSSSAAPVHSSYSHSSLPEKNDNASNRCYCPPPGYEFDRADDAIHTAVLKVIESVANFSKTFTPHMERTLFVSLVKAITDELNKLLSETSSCLLVLDPDSQHQVQLIETLLGSDMKNMANCVTAAFDLSATEEDSELARRQVLKVATQLAFNCKYFLESVDSARIQSGVAKLKRIDTSTKHSSQ